MMILNLPLSKKHRAFQLVQWLNSEYGIDM